MRKRAELLTPIPPNLADSATGMFVRRNWDNAKLPPKQRKASTTKDTKFHEGLRESTCFVNLSGLGGSSLG